MATSRHGLVFIHPSDERYGADRMLLAMLASLPPRTEVEIWLPSDLDHPPMPLCTILEERGYLVRHLDVPILRRSDRTPRGLARLAARSRRLARELRVRAPERVYCTTTAACVAAPVARLVGVPHVISHVQEIWSRADSVALTPLLAWCQTRLAISAAVRDSLPRVFWRSTTVVPNGTPAPESFSPLDGRSGDLQFVVASRWNGWKGHETLLRAWDLAGVPGRLVVLGGPPLSGDRTDVVALVAQLRRPESVHVVGEVPDPSPYLDQADIVLVPSERPEPFGLVAIEAFARGRPVIASDAGGLREVVTHGTDGWLFEPGDAAGLSELLTGLTRDQVTVAGRAARAAFEARFTEARWAEEWRSAVFGDVADRR